MIRYIKVFFLLYIIILLIFSFEGCATSTANSPINKDGKLCGVTKGAFRDRWWNYYERALSFADCEYYKEAELDLMEAIRQRKDDKRQANTFGYHYVDYFPHREIGIIFFKQGKIEESLNELNMSLAYEKSSKTQFYIDRVRKLLIEKKHLDKLPPEIIIETPKQNHLTNSLSINIRGIARDDTFVKRISVGDKEFRIDASDKEIPFSMEVFLQPGNNSIPILAEDLSGKITTSNLNIIVDRLGPIIRIDSPIDGEQVNNKTDIQLKGYAYDDSGIIEFVVNGIKYACDGSKELQIQKNVLLQAGEPKIKVEVKDLAGNITIAEILLGQGSKQIGFHSIPFISKDNALPVIQLRNSEKQQTTYLEQSFIEGNIKDNKNIKSLLINNEQIVKNPGNNIYFSHLVGLKAGENIITIKGTNTADNTSEVTLNIRRDTLKVREISSRLCVVVNSFEKITIGEEKQLSFGIEDHIASSMTKNARFSVVDRKNLKEVIKEIEISLSGMADESKALKAGKILTADCMLSGSILERKNSLEIYARLIDTETTEVITAVDLYGEDIDINALRTLGQGLSLKLNEEIPVAEGFVVKTEGDNIVIDLGKNKKIKKGMKLIVFKIGDQIIHPATGKVLGSGVEELMQARIKDVMDEMSYAVPTKTASKNISVMQHVIMR